MTYKPRAHHTDTGRIWTVVRTDTDRPVLSSDGFPRIWFDRTAAAAYARKRTAIDAQSSLFPSASNP